MWQCYGERDIIYRVDWTSNYWFRRASSCTPVSMRDNAVHVLERQSYST